MGGGVVEGSSELLTVVHGWFRAAAGRDPSWWDRHLAPDPRLRVVGTGHDEVASGQDALDLLTDPAHHAGDRPPVVLEHVEAHAQDDVGWAFATPRIELPGGPLRLRWTAVLVRDPEWRVVQLHVSQAVPHG